MRNFNFTEIIWKAINERKIEVAKQKIYKGVCKNPL